MKTLILGGVKSGKSYLAENIAKESGKPVIYLATATAGDEEMRQRIAEHQRRRPSDWSVVEEPLHLADALQAYAAPQNCLLLDCLTLWLTQLLMTEDDVLLERERKALLKIVQTIPGELIMVSNETNMGVMPMGALSRRYCDEAGRLHQRLAQCCDRVILTVAGLPHVLKG